MACRAEYAIAILFITLCISKVSEKAEHKTFFYAIRKSRRETYERTKKRRPNEHGLCAQTMISVKVYVFHFIVRMVRLKHRRNENKSQHWGKLSFYAFHALLNRCSHRAFAHGRRSPQHTDTLNAKEHRSLRNRCRM